VPDPYARRMALQTSAEQPVPVRTVANAIGQWVGRLGAVWVEGQVAQLNRRQGSATGFLTLRDPVAEVSLQVTASRQVLDACQPPLVEGARIVVHARPDFYLARGTLSLQAREIRPVGLGELLARLERVKAMLAAEGLFAAERKRPLPFLPRTVGLICGRASAAQRDVMHHATARWPAVRFRVEEVPVQGLSAVTEVIAAVQRLDRDREVDVIVVARGGGSVEDLLPFSDEQLVRAVAQCATPVVSAIGHEPDTPLLDLVADLRASTPTDAGRRIVPEVAEQVAALDGARHRLRQAVSGALTREQALLDQLRNRPSVADPHRMVDERADEIDAALRRARRCMVTALDRAVDEVHHTRARVRSLSPAATLERGYAVVQRADGAVVREAGELVTGDRVHVRVAVGAFDAAVSSAGPHAAEAPRSGS
jgi:exodeoxyribonuclease VII large subunit